MMCMCVYLFVCVWCVDCRQAGDDENTYVHAHFIGSSCGNVGAEAMLKAARATEHAAKDHDAQGVLDNYAKLQEEYAKAKAWFTEKYP